MYILLGLNKNKELVYAKIEQPFTPIQQNVGLYVTKVKSEGYIIEKAHDMLTKGIFSHKRTENYHQYFNCGEGASSRDVAIKLAEKMGEALMPHLRVKIKLDDQTYYIDEDSFHEILTVSESLLKKTMNMEIANKYQDIVQYFDKNYIHDMDDLLEFKKLLEESKEKKEEGMFVKELLVSERLKGCLS